MIVLYFFIIALMRVIQAVCNKSTSNLLNSPRSIIHYIGYTNFVAAALGLIVLFFEGFWGFDLATLVLGFFMGLSLALANLSGLMALKHSSVALHSTVSNGSIIVPAIAGIFLFSEPMSIFAWLSVVVFVIAVYLIASKSSSSTQAPLSIKTLLLLLAVFLTNGATMVLQKYFSAKLPDGNVTMFSFLSFFTNAVLFYLATGAISLKTRSLPPPIPHKALLFGGALSIAVFVISQLITISAKTMSSATLFTISSALSIVIMTAVGKIRFRETINRKVIIGVILCILAAVLINFF